MSWEGVPWMVAGGFHSAEVGRLLAYAATGGGEGVVSPGDCKVTASAIPDGNIHIAPGGVGVLNRFPGGAAQAYLVRNVGDEVEALTPQGSSGVRYDLVAMIVEDPQYAGQPAPPSVPDGPYVRTAIYTNVPAGTTKLSEVDPDQTGYALARVKFDASDGTVSAADITDLRRVLAPRVKVEKKILNVGAGATTLGADAVIPPGAAWSIDIPEWATDVLLEANWSGLRATDTGADGGTASGNGRVTLGSIATANSLWSENAVGPGKTTRVGHMAADDKPVPSGLRGTSQTLEARMSKTAGSGMNVKSDSGSTVVVTATFYEKAS